MINLGGTAARKRVLSLVSLFTAFIILTSCSHAPYVPPPGETEATEYQGIKLTPISDQGNNALAGTQHIDRNSYKLIVDGLTGTSVSLTYQDLLNLPQVSKVVTLHCVEGWSFTAKIAIFHTADVPAGYSSLDLSYIQGQNIIIALKLNDVTMPVERGFPFQVVATGKFGYKWSKWVTRIELSSNQNFRGYWESRGYDNEADIG